MIEQTKNIETKDDVSLLGIPCYRPAFDLHLFASLLICKRIEFKISLRKAAKQIGISAASLSRIENEKFTPDLETFYKCCLWSNYKMEMFFKLTKNNALGGFVKPK